MNVDADIVEDAQRLRPKESEVMRLVCDAAKLRERTGWRPRLDQGRGPAADHRLVPRPANLARFKIDEYHV